MKDRYHFFKNNILSDVALDDQFDWFYFKPNIFKRKLHKGLYRHSDLLYVFWFLFTFGRYEILYVIDKKTGEISHFSNILPTIFKYNFMKKDDVQIVNCWTYEGFRGRKLYSFALSSIQNKFKSKTIWIGSKISNIASLKVIKNSGFIKMFTVEKKTILGIYYRVDE